MTEPSPKPHPASIGPYRVEGTLGEGGMGTVFRGFDEALARPVALKVLSRTLAQDPESRKRFAREARAAAGIGHPNVVQVFQIGEAEGRTYIAMELVEGASLEELIESRGRLPPEEALEVMIQVVDGLEAAWRNGIVHRDVKPANVLVRADGLAKVADFGLSKAYGGDKSLTQSGMVMGTPRYMSPEQGEGKPLDFRSDIYSLGATLYHCLVGAPPFEADTPVSVIVKHITSPVPSLEDVAPDLPVVLGRVIEKMLQKSPADRHPSYAELREELRDAARALADPDPSEARTLAARPVGEGPRTSASPRPTRAPSVREPVLPSPPVSRRLGPIALAALLVAIAAFAVGRRIPITRDATPPAGGPHPTPNVRPTDAPGPSAARTPIAPSPSPAASPSPPTSPALPAAGDAARVAVERSRDVAHPGDDAASTAVASSPRHRAEELAGRAAEAIARGDGTAAREGLEELDRCLEDGSCSAELVPTAGALAGSLAARNGDATRAKASFAKAFRASRDAAARVLVPAEEGPEWIPLAGAAARELARFPFGTEEARTLVPDLPDAEAQLAFARSVGPSPLRGPGAGGDVVRQLAQAAYERVVARFPGRPAAAAAEDAITIALLSGRSFGEAATHVEAIVARMQSAGAPWQELNDQLVFLGSAFIGEGIPERGRKSFEQARKISEDPRDPVRVVRRDGVESVPLEDFMKETLRTFLREHPNRRRMPRDGGADRPRPHRPPP